MQQPPAKGVDISFWLIWTTYSFNVYEHYKSMIDCVIVRYLGTAVFFTHGEVQSAESKNYHRKLRQGLHQFFSLVLEYRHTRSGHT